jgi:molecular chaperone GrpE
VSAADRKERPATMPEDEGARSDAGASSAEGFEPAPRADAAEAAAEDVSADLDVLLKDTARERDEYLEIAQRARADFENYRKRAAREAAEAERRGRVAVARELVPALDNLERALGSVGGAPEEGERNSDSLIRGIELVLRELEGALSRSGVEAYDPAGEAFDPAWHEAVATRPAQDAGPGTVLETLERGYRLDGQVLRAAKVVVGE